MINPLGLMQAMRNPQAFMQQAMNNSEIAKNPVAKNAFELYQKGDKEGLKQLAENLCKENGTTMEEMTKRIMSQIKM